MHARTGAYFIDRNGNIFEVLLEFFRTGEVDFDMLNNKGISMKALMREAQFYCVDKLIGLIEAHQAEQDLLSMKEEETRPVVRTDGYYSLVLCEGHGMNNHHHHNHHSPSSSTPSAAAVRECCSACMMISLANMGTASSSHSTAAKCCDAICFLEDGRCVFAHGQNSGNNLIVFHSIAALPSLWKEVEVGEAYARFVTHMINSGKYWVEGESLKLVRGSASSAFLAVGKGDSLYIHSSEEGFLRYSFTPWPKI